MLLFVRLLALLLIPLGASVVSAQLVATPFAQTGLPLTTLQSELLYSVDLGSLPLRPRMIVEVTPDAAHPDLELEILISNCSLTGSSGACVNPGGPNLGDPRWQTGIGRSTAYWDLFTCEVATEYLGETCEIRIKPLAFGDAGKPATVDVTIRGETRVPTATATVEVDTTVQTTGMPAVKDTTLYQANGNAGNGLGESIWVSSGTGTNAMNGLLAFDLAAAVPADVFIRDADLVLSVLSATPGATFDLHAVPDGLDWIEGTSNAAGDESTPPAPGVGPHASWSYRRWSLLLVNPGPWSTPGGDREPTPLATGTVSSLGPIVISSPELTDHVRAIQAGTKVSDGFLLVPTSGSIRFGSEENAMFENEPQLVVEYTGAPTPLPNVDVGTMSFFNEGQNFRWIYDLDNDYVFSTPIQGRCEVFNPTSPGPFKHMSYQFQGSPTYQGVDCCTWQVGSTTGVTGTGQLITHVNVSSTNPAYTPLDGDADGIKDLCDNCPSIPNGPLYGSCLAGPRATSLCKSDQECSGFPCSLAQDDADRNRTGDACVPEPGLGAMLASGLVALGLRAASRPASPRRRWRRVLPSRHD